MPLDEVFAFAPGKSDDVLALDEALTNLALVDERKCRIIELRYFAGFSVDETARASTSPSARLGVNSGWPRRGCIASCRSTHDERRTLAGDRRAVRAGVAAAVRRADGPPGRRLRVDDELRREVVSLLASHNAGGGFLQHRIEKALASFYDTSVAGTQPVRVGPAPG